MTCLIIAAHLESRIREIVNPDEYSFVICADSSYVQAFKEDVFPDLIIGDFDHNSSSLPPDRNIETILLPVKKDDTDTHFCVKEAIKRGFDDITIIGGTGGRLDHTIANIQSLVYACRNGTKARMMDKNNIITVTDRDCTVDKKKKYLSVFSIGGKAVVSIEGCKYSQSNIELTDSFPIGVSNEISSDTALISVSKGTIILVQSDD